MYRFWASSRLYHLIKKLRDVVLLVREVEYIHRNDVETSRGYVGLSQAQEETSSEEARVVLHKTLSDGDASENEHPHRD